MRVQRVLVPDRVEEVDTVRACEKRCRDRVDGRITPTLSFCIQSQSGRVFFWFSSKGERKNLRGSLQYLIVEATTTIEVLEKRGIGLTAPKVHIGDLKVAPNYL